MLLCLRCASGSKPPQDSEVCFQLRISDAEWSKSKSTLRSLDLIDGSNRPVAWDKRQYVSDCSTERVYKYRRNVSETFQKRPQSQSTETEAKSEKTNGQKPPAPHHPFALIWNENCGTLPAIEKLTPGRLRQCRVREKDCDAETFRRAVTICAGTPFLTGHNDRGWRADFDWLIQNDKNLFRVLEGKYAGNGTHISKHQESQHSTLSAARNILEGDSSEGVGPLRFALPSRTH